MKFLLTLMMVFSMSTAYGESMTAKKKYSYNEAITRAEEFFREKGLTIFASVDHKAGAEAVKLSLPPAKLYIFGNARIGTPLMVDNPVMSLYLPLRLAVYQNHEGEVFYSVPNITEAGATETLSKESLEVLLRMDKLLRELLYH
ncbi:MAG: DUF302 domain-containing protein [Brevinema sp.]